MRKRFVSLGLVVVMVLSCIPFMSVTASANDYPKLYEIVREYDEHGALHEYIIDENGNRVSASEYNYETKDDLLHTSSADEVIPSSYSSVVQGRVTSVKNQGSFGTCWAHSFIAAAESSLISQGYADASIDLSEAHLVWFRRHNYVENSSIPVQRDYYSQVTNTFTHGGNEHDAVAVVARKSGFTTEEKFPYNSTDSSTMQFDQADMFECDYELSSARFFLSDETEEIKSSIMEYGALCSSYYHDVSFYSTRDYSYYQTITSGTNHGITIVGWDDNYPASRFRIPPATDGAWLCKNSWGENWGDNGYFWISYADRSLYQFWEVVAKPARDEFVYQYNGIGSLMCMIYNNKGYAANIFTAEKTQTIRECSFMLGNTVDVDCTATLYVNIGENSTDPTSGKKIVSQTINCTQRGFYRIPLPNDYILAPQERFSIVLSYALNTEGEKLYIPYEDRSADYATYYSEPGQSFYSMNGYFWSDSYNYSNLGNNTIKAYADDVEKRPVSIEINTAPEQNSFFVNEPFDYSGLSLNVVYNDRTTGTLYDGFTVLADTSIIGQQYATVSYEGLSITYPITVTENVPVAINSVTKAKNYFFINSIFEPKELILNVTFLNGEVRDVTRGYTYEAVTFNALGDYEVDINYAGLTATTTAHVIPTQTLKAKSDSTALINYDTHTVSGLQAGLASLEDFVYVDEGYSYTLQNSASSYIGTGTVISVYIENELIDKYTVIIFGDVTGDSFYNGQDAVIIKCLVNNFNIPMSAVFVKAADCNHDGFVTAEDAELAESAGVYLTDIIQLDIIIETDSAEQLSAQNSVQYLREEQPSETQGANWIICLIISIFDFFKSILKF